jgi:hypothetical protein
MPRRVTKASARKQEAVHRLQLLRLIVGVCTALVSLARLLHDWSS